jgi:hypothetical protein
MAGSAPQLAPCSPNKPFRPRWDFCVRERSNWCAYVHNSEAVAIAVPRMMKLGPTDSQRENEQAQVNEKHSARETGDDVGDAPLKFSPRVFLAAALSQRCNVADE